MSLHKILKIVALVLGVSWYDLLGIMIIARR